MFGAGESAHQRADCSAGHQRVRTLTVDLRSTSCGGVCSARAERGVRLHPRGWVSPAADHSGRERTGPGGFHGRGPAGPGRHRTQPRPRRPRARQSRGRQDRDAAPHACSPSPPDRAHRPPATPTTTPELGLRLRRRHHPRPHQRASHALLTPQPYLPVRDPKEPGKPANRQDQRAQLRNRADRNRRPPRQVHRRFRQQIGVCLGLDGFRDCRPSAMQHGGSWKPLTGAQPWLVRMAQQGLTACPAHSSLLFNNQMCRPGCDTRRARRFR